MPKRFTFYALIVSLFFVSFKLHATIVLPSLISDNMVLQQQTNAGLWGKADPASTVAITASWNKRLYSIKADDAGNWKIKIPTPVYGGPYTIMITQGNTITLHNVMIGEVWLCSGQSNMEMPLAGWGKIKNYQYEIDNANYPDIRLLQAKHVASNQPTNDLKLAFGWVPCSPATIPEFSATAYFFAREMYNKTKIPIGLIHSSWGGTVAEAWTGYETLKTMPDFSEAATLIKNTTQQSISQYEEKLKEWQDALIKADKGYPTWKANDLNTSEWKTMKRPVLWEDAGLPDFDGVVWFRKRITLPENLTNDDLVLNLGTIDDEDITWFNGVKIGETKNYAAERKYIIPKSLLKPGENYIVVRVTDTGGGGGFYGDEKSMFIKNKEGEVTPIYGEWLYNPAYTLKDIPVKPVDPNQPNRPGVLYNAMIHPILNYTIRGAIWYQGESNAGRAYQYRTLFPAMIKDWRNKFGLGDFPFYFVQLANYMKKDVQPGSSNWAELREAQLMTTALKNTGMATIIDIGEEKDIHPKNKQEVGRRLALIALNKVYRKGNEYSGPLFTSYRIEGNTIRIHFDHAKGMYVKGDKLLGFAIAGADRQFHWANAVIKGSDVVVSSNEVANPVAVRYGWANNPDVNLYNNAALPASPFRTDEWKESTYNVK